MPPPSEVWNYFKKIDTGNKVRCAKCQMELTFCNSTSSLIKHLRTAHKIELISATNKRKRSESFVIDEIYSESENLNNVSQTTSTCQKKVEEVKYNIFFLQFKSRLSII